MKENARNYNSNTKKFFSRSSDGKANRLVKIYLKEAGSIPILTEEKIIHAFQKIEKSMIHIKGVIGCFKMGLDEIFLLHEKAKHNTVLLDNLSHFDEDGRRVKTMNNEKWRSEFASNVEILKSLVEKKAATSAKIEKANIQKEITTLVKNIKLHPLQVMNLSCKIVEEVKQISLRKDVTLVGNKVYFKEKDWGVSLEKAVRLAGYLNKLEARIKDTKKYVVESNLRLVINIAKKYSEGGVPFMDLVQEGNLGLMRAVNRYDYTRGYHFSTYATWWIKQAVVRAIADQGKTIRIPVHMVEILKKYDRVHNKLVQQYKRKPTLAELSQSMDVSEKRISDMCSYAKKTISLDMPIIDGDKKIEDMLCDSTSKSPVEVFERTKLQENVDRLLKTLDRREEKVLRMRYGIGENSEYTLTEIGSELGVCRERIRQLEKRSLKKLEKPFVVLG